MASFFLSYSRSDQAFALRLADDLIAAGAPVWVDQYDIHPSQHWDHAVETAVRGCQGLIVVLSPRSAASPNVADEIAVALDAGKLVIPVLMEACSLPLRLVRMQFIDATRSYETALGRCLAAMGKAQDGAAVPPASEPTPKATLPETILRQAELRLTGIMGPIAAVLVRQAAGAASEVELYDRLARAIPGPAERNAFLAWIAAPPAETAPAPIAEPEPLDAADLDVLTRALTRHLGPIAATLVARERRLASTRQILRERLAARIADAKDRAAFLRESAK